MVPQGILGSLPCQAPNKNLGQSGVPKFSNVVAFDTGVGGHGGDRQDTATIV